MANFEALIKQALKTQNSADPIVREKIYASSRVALRRMLEKSGNKPVESLKAHLQNLEDSIVRIESEFAQTPAPAPTMPAPVAAPTAELQIAQPVAPPAQAKMEPTIDMGLQPRAVPQPKPVVEPQAPQVSAAPTVSPEPVAPVAPPRQEAPALLEPTHAATTPVDPQYAEQAQTNYESVAVPPSSDDRPKYNRTNPFLRKIWWLLFIVAGLAVALWLLYALSSMTDNNNSSNSASRTSSNAADSTPSDDNSVYITLIDPDDQEALFTSGRGAASIIEEFGTKLLRVQSIRQNGINQLADPILLELQQGVLRQVAGKDVTVEIKVKSGEQDNATFSVQCSFDGVNSCERKRFQVGLQPVDIVFALKVPSEAINGNAFLNINTDVTSKADQTGKGDQIDIVYARIRMAK